MLFCWLGQTNFFISVNGQQEKKTKLQQLNELPVGLCFQFLFFFPFILWLVICDLPKKKKKTALKVVRYLFPQSTAVNNKGGQFHPKTVPYLKFPSNSTQLKV